METVVRRVQELEKRLDLVETVVGLQPFPERKPAPKPEPVRVIERPAPGPLVPQPPVGRRPRVAKTVRRPVEVDVGQLILSRAGALSLVVAAGFLFHYAAQEGFLSPSVRVFLGGVAGLGLLAAGERIMKRYAVFSAALTGAGLGILFTTLFAAHGLYGFIGSAPALLLASAIAGAGVVQALRHGIPAIAVLSAVGGFLAPAFILDLKADAAWVLSYVLILNAGLAAVAARRQWLSAEVMAWIGTAVCVPLPLMNVSLSSALAYVVAYGVLLGVSARLRIRAGSPILAGALSVLVGAGSYALFSHNSVDGWSWFGGALGLLLIVGALLQGRRTERIAKETANTDLVCGVVFLVLAAADRWAHFDLVVAWSILTAALLAPRHRVLAEPMRVLGSIVACLALGLLLLDDFYIFTLGIYPALIVGAAIASARTRLFGWAGVAIASVGIAGHIAVLLDAEPWSTLLLVEPQQAILPSARLVAGGTLAVLIGAFAYWRRNRNVVNAACAYAAVLAGAELLLHIDGIGTVPLGLAAAGVLLALPSRFRSIWPVSVALLLAVASDLIPPENYWPFLNRRALALTAVLGSGFVLLRNKTEARACLLLIGLLATVEVASAVDPAGGASPWSHLLLDARTTVGASPLWNARFFFLVGAAAIAFLAARRWRPALVFGHIYVAAALGAELVGLVDPALRSHPWRMFGDPGQFMAEQLWLTGLLLSYGTVLVAVGIARDGALMRKVGLGFLAAGALKVSMIDLSSLDALYRVGSFLVLGATFLLGSYAYNRLRLHGDE